MDMPASRKRSASLVVIFPFFPHNFSFAHHTAASSVAVWQVSDEKGGEPLVKTKIPLWGNARFWLVVVVAELILVAMLDPGLYVNGLRLLMQVFQVHLP